MRDKRRRVLIVDPDPSFAAKISMLLSSQGYKVEVVEGITRAAQCLKDVKFGCVVMDENLPEMKGHDAVPVLKTISPTVPIIVTTAQNTPEVEARIRQQDVFFYYVKSFGAQELQMAVRDAFRNFRKEPAAMTPDRPARVLIVDDDRDFVAAIESVLKNNSYEVSAAYSKEEAVKMVESDKPDLVVLDIMMEGLGDGFSICKKLKYDRELRHIPVLVVSSVTEKTGLSFPTQTGADDFAADDYLEKPVRVAELLQRVENLCVEAGTHCCRGGKDMAEELTAGATVVVIDNEESTREACRHLLEYQGYRVATAANSERGLRLVKETRPDVVLVEPRMPGTSGMEMLKRILEVHPSVALIVITGYVTVESAVEAMRLGASDFLCKPLDEKELLAAIEQALEEVYSQQGKRRAARTLVEMLTVP